MIISSQTLSLYYRERAIALAKAGLDFEVISGLEEESSALAKIVRCSHAEGAARRKHSTSPWREGTAQSQPIILH